LSYSGKTYLRLMLLAHPDLMITRRTKMWTRFLGRFDDLSEHDNLERCLDAMMQARHVRELQPDLDRVRREFYQGPATYAHLFEILHRQHAEMLGKRRWGDQLGRVEAYADHIFAAYPTAKMIHMVRDPRQRCAISAATSRHRQAKLGWETAAWRHSVRLAKRNHVRYPGRYLVLQYEKLLGCREKTLRRVCAFIGEAFLPEMLNVDGVPHTENGPLENIRAELAQSMNDRETALFQAGVGRELNALDYSPRQVQLSAWEWLLLTTIDLPLNLAGQFLWWATEDKRAN
jgi:hypothetical protein